jgi:DNA polymerase-3 subunit gamma/tau
MKSMLSEKAFALQTLEEPPPREVHLRDDRDPQVPVTVLSRCQRFDLRRVPEEELSRHFAAIAAKEGVRISTGALGLIARAADGSVRDGLSLLDQAITLRPGEATQGEVDEAMVRDMLGLADRTRLIDLYQAVLDANAPSALDHLADMYRSGADPSQIMQDLLELTHWLTRVRISPADLKDATVPEAERRWAEQLGKGLTLPLLARFWQMLLKGLAEVEQAPQPLAAAEMVLIRLIHSMGLPDPADLVRRLSGEGQQASMQERTKGAGAGSSMDSPAPLKSIAGGAMVQAAPVMGEIAMPASAPGSPRPESFLEVVELFRERREGLLTAHLQGDVHLVRFERGRIEFRPEPRAPANLANRISACLAEWTGERWLVSVSSEPGLPTLKEQAASLQAHLRQRASQHPLVKAAMAAFPGATIDQVRDLTQAASADNRAGAGETGEPFGEEQ